MVFSEEEALHALNFFRSVFWSEPFAFEGAGHGTRANARCGKVARDVAR
jgi:hypothetical protein